MVNSGCFESMFPQGNNCLKPVYFDIQVLERYFDDPKYLVFYQDYRGTIIVDDDYVDEDFENLEYLKDFGLAYNKKEDIDRAIVTFADDLMKMPPKMQSHFHSYYLDNQDDYYPNEGFVKNLILGEWVDTISVYQALTLELHYINKMCEAIGIPRMFLNEFSLDTGLQNDRPNNYHTLLLPTKQRYYDFVITLEKMITGNLNINTFITPSLYVLTIDRKNENGENKGSLTMLIEWFEKNVKMARIKEDIGLPLRELIHERQKPAHKIYKNEYDKTLWTKQNLFMEKIYTAVRNIRLLLANHPKSKVVEVPEYLFDGMHIRTY